MGYILTKSLEQSQEKFISGNFIHWKMCSEISKNYNINDSTPAFLAEQFN